ncbi:MAG: UPF0234 protein [Candidatus Binatia bacterium]|nr:MAG: UPF0234 protein [Candidatus Binatia bacterium]
MPSFDIVSQVHVQEVDNAVNQTRKEVSQRYDFKDTATEILWDKEKITIVSDNDFKVKAVVDILQSKLARRGVSLKALRYGPIEPAGGGRARQAIEIQQGIDAERARQIVKCIKDSKLKVQAQIQDDQVRVSGKKKDDLQTVIRLLGERDFGIPIQFVNFRD